MNTVFPLIEEQCIRTMPSDPRLPLEEIQFAGGGRGNGCFAARAASLLLAVEFWQNKRSFFANFS